MSTTTTTLDQPDTKIDLAIHESALAELRSAVARLQRDKDYLERRVEFYQRIIRQFNTRHERVMAERVMLAEQREESAGR